MNIKKNKEYMCACSPLLTSYMWIPSHVGVRGNKRADQAGDAVENGMEWHAPVRPSDFLPLSRVRLLEGWQSGWDGSNMGSFCL
jgi:hypothetical protein